MLFNRSQSNSLTHRQLMTHRHAHKFSDNVHSNTLILYQARCSAKSRWHVRDIFLCFDSIAQRQLWHGVLLRCGHSNAFVRK